MRQLADLGLLGLQWLLVLWGVFLIAVSISTLRADMMVSEALQRTVANGPGDTYYLATHWQRFNTGVVTGLIVVGLGAALFYLRRIFLRKRGSA